MHRTLGALAEKCHAFAKALHYKELEYATSPDTAVEALISINNQLRQPEAAIGILTLAQDPASHGAEGATPHPCTGLAGVHAIQQCNESPMVAALSVSETDTKWHNYGWRRPALQEACGAHEH